MPFGVSNTQWNRTHGSVPPPPPPPPSSGGGFLGGVSHAASSAGSAVSSAVSGGGGGGSGGGHTPQPSQGNLFTSIAHTIASLGAATAKATSGGGVAKSGYAGQSQATLWYGGVKQYMPAVQSLAYGTYSALKMANLLPPTAKFPKFVIDPKTLVPDAWAYVDNWNHGIIHISPDLAKSAVHPDQTVQNTFIHELAHTMQNAATWGSKTMAEGGADAWMRAARSKLTKSGAGISYPKEVAQMTTREPFSWITQGQFDPKATPPPINSPVNRTGKRSLQNVLGSISGGIGDIARNTPSVAPPPSPKVPAMFGVGGGGLFSGKASQAASFPTPLGYAPPVQTVAQFNTTAPIAGAAAGRILAQAAQRGIEISALTNQFLKGGGQITNPGSLIVRGAPMTPVQQHWANQIIQIGHQLGAPPLAIQAALYAASAESNLGADTSAMTSANTSGYGGLMQGNTSWLLSPGNYDHAGQIKAFYQGDSNRGFQGGGAINLVKSGTTDPAEIAIRVEVPSYWPKNAYANYYDTTQGMKESAAMLKAAGGGPKDTAGLQQFLQSNLPKGGGQAPAQVAKTGLNAAIAAANAISSNHYNYSYGGGHTTIGQPTGGQAGTGFDCSGAVSAILHSIGMLSSPLDSSGFMSYGQPGAGGKNDITIYANSGHVFMQMGGKYFGTSKFGHPAAGHGPSWFTQAPDPGYLSGFTVRHVTPGKAPAGSTFAASPNSSGATAPTSPSGAPAAPATSTAPSGTNTPTTGGGTAAAQASGTSTAIAPNIFSTLASLEAARQSLVGGGATTPDQSQAMWQLLSQLYGGGTKGSVTTPTSQSTSSKAVKYVDPFAGAQVTAPPVTLAVDNMVNGPIRALGNSKVVSVQDNPGVGTVVTLQLTDGTHAGQKYYFSGSLSAKGLHPGMTVTAGQQIAVGMGGVDHGFAGQNGVPLAKVKKKR